MLEYGAITSFMIRFHDRKSGTEMLTPLLHSSKFQDERGLLPEVRMDTPNPGGPRTPLRAISGFLGIPSQQKPSPEIGEEAGHANPFPWESLTSIAKPGTIVSPGLYLHVVLFSCCKLAQGN